MDCDDHPSALAWIWVIEALSTSKEITTPTLRRFIDIAPVGLQKFSKNTMELLALRSLDKLSTRVVDPEASSTLDSRIRFNVLRSSDDVLQEMLREIPLSNLKISGAELLKWDVCPFIKHKRAATFKCHLEQMREAILDGTYPVTADDFKETSGLFPQNSRRFCSKRSMVCPPNEINLPSKRSKVCSADETDLQLKDPNNHTFVAEPCHDTSMEDTVDTAHHAIPTNDANEEKNQHMINLHQPNQTETDITSLNLCRKLVASDKTVVESLPIEENLCMKCDGGHRNCLGASAAQLDAKGNFFCSYCAYHHATSEYLEARKNISLARKALAIFIRKVNSKQTKHAVDNFGGRADKGGSAEVW